MNRVLKRPMFRIGGSAGTGITSGLDKPQKMANGGRTGYYQGSMPSFQATGMPGFLTGLGLNLLATPPQGNIFATTAVAARDPFNRLQAGQAAAMKTASDRAFAKELAQEERDFLSGETTRKLESAERIAGMKTDELSPDLLKKYDNNEIKAQREKDFYASTYNNLVDQYGDKTVATTVFDSEDYQKKGALERYLKQNPQLARQVVYDVATGKAVRFVKNSTTGKFEIVPADSADIDTTGEIQPAPGSSRSFDYFNPDQKEKIEELGSEFSEDFYSAG
jgi:hypothetical protein